MKENIPTENDPAENDPVENDQVVTPHPSALISPKGDGADETKSQTWLHHFWPLLLSAMLSLAWGAVCLWWFMESEKSVSRMPLYEIGGLLAGASMPLVLIWLVALVYLRSDPLRDHRLALAHGLDGLLSPLEVAQRRVNTIVAGIHKEISHVEAASDIAVTRIDNLEKRFQDQISSLFDVTTSAEDKAVKLTDNLTREREAYTNLSQEAVNQITEMKTLFDQLVFDSETITNTTRKNSEKVSNEITFQNKTLEERAKQIESRLEKMAQNLEGLSQNISDKTTLSQDNLESMSTTLNQQQEQISQIMAALSRDTENICVQISTQAQNISELSKNTAEESEKLTQTIKDQAKDLEQAATDALGHTTQSGEAFTLQANALNKSINDVTDSLDVKSESLQHSISARINAMEEAMVKQTEIIRSGLAEHSDLFDHNFKNTVDTFEIQAGKISENVEKTTEKLELDTANMSAHFTSYENMAEKFADKISQSADQLTAYHEDLSRTIGNVSDNMDQASEQLKNNTGELGRHAQGIIDNIVAQTDQLIDKVEDVRERSESAIRNIQEMENTVSQHFNATDENAALLAESWRNTASLIENQSIETLSNLDNLTGKLHTLEGENNKAADIAEKNIKKISDELQHASEKIYLASASAIEASDESKVIIDQHTDKFQQLINAIQMSSKSIIADAEAVEKRLLQKSGNAFSSLASKLIEQLQSLSIDINRYFDEDISDDLWQLYVNGDKSAFVRRLRKLVDKKQSKQIKEKYKNDPEFRKYVLDYLHLFEDLMSQSMASDNYSIFSVALISSETGKVYLALAQATDRIKG